MIFEFVAHLDHAPPGIRIQNLDRWTLGVGSESETSNEMVSGIGEGGNRGLSLKLLNGYKCQCPCPTGPSFPRCPGFPSLCGLALSAYPQSGPAHGLGAPPSYSSRASERASENAAVVSMRLAASTGH